MLVLLAAILMLSLEHTHGQTIKFLVVTESAQQDLNAKFSEGLKSVQDANPGFSLDMSKINFTRKFADDAFIELCNLLQSSQYTAIIDMAWGGWIKVQESYAEKMRFFYFLKRFFFFFQSIFQKHVAPSIVIYTNTALSYLVFFP